jgi:hypothetical protein
VGKATLPVYALLRSPYLAACGSEWDRAPLFLREWAMDTYYVETDGVGGFVVKVAGEGGMST